MSGPLPKLTVSSSTNAGETPLPRQVPATTQDTNRKPDSNSTLRPDAGASHPTSAPRKKRNHRGGKKKRARRQSFAPSGEDEGSGMLGTPISHRSGMVQSAVRPSFYRLQGHNLSSTSIESEELLDHR